jgi:hypothetical protein
VNALFCDGHVEFVENQIGLAVWQALGSRKGGEVAENF